MGADMSIPEEEAEAYRERGRQWARERIARREQELLGANIRQQDQQAEDLSSHQVAGAPGPSDVAYEALKQRDPEWLSEVLSEVLDSRRAAADAEDDEMDDASDELQSPVTLKLGAHVQRRDSMFSGTAGYARSSYSAQTTTSSTQSPDPAFLSSEPVDAATSVVPQSSSQQPATKRRVRPPEPLYMATRTDAYYSHYFPKISTYERQYQTLYSHIARIEETEYGTERDRPCQGCEKRGTVCRVYSQAGLEKFGHGNSKRRCARCRLGRNHCL